MPKTRESIRFLHLTPTWTGKKMRFLNGFLSPCWEKNQCWHDRFYLQMEVTGLFEGKILNWFVGPDVGTILRKNYYLQTHGHGQEMAVAFSNIFMNKVDTEILSQSELKPRVWKRFIEDIFSLWTINRYRIEQFIEQVNDHHPTIKFTAEICDKETTFLDTYMYKGARFERFARFDAILDVRTHFKRTETFQYTHFKSCHPQRN